MLTISLDVTKIDKARLKEVRRKNGETAKFLDLVLIDTPNSEYGDYVVTQQVSKEERENGVKLPILGNAKNVVKGGNKQGGKPSGKKNDGWDDQGSGDAPW
jgi:NurA-like 5'-3' nuclease